jgi:hypothetical protein
METVAIADHPDNSGAHSGALLPDLSRNRQPGIQPAAYVEEAGFTTVPIDLAEREAVFVVFRRDVSAPPPPTPQMTQATLATLTGPWTVEFPPHWGAPASIQLPELISWTASSISGVKYFSGTAAYIKDMRAPAAWFRPGRHLYLDLGTVRDIAQVEVNGKSAGLVWAPPYLVDATGALRPGVNHLRIEVTNEWTNRILGDRPLPPEQRVLPQAFPPPGVRVFSFGPREPAESGLIGKVRVVAEEAR